VARLAAQVTAFAEEGARQTARTLARTITYREGKAPGAPVDTGELRGSLRFTVGEPSTEQPQKGRRFHAAAGAVEVDQSLESFRLGMLIWGRIISRHALIIEGGRRKDKRGRDIGSLRAPDGYVWLAIDETGSVMRRWKFRGRKR
jgi:hypothetical protein